MTSLPPGAEAFRKRFEASETLKRDFADLLDDCYDYALPLRNRTTLTGLVRRTDKLFDGTASTGLQGLASMLLEDVWPSSSRPFDLLPGASVPRDRHEEFTRDLALVADDLIDTANNSNFRAAAHEMLLDFGIGTGVMLVEEGDAIDPVRHTCVPLTEATLGLGPRGQIGAMYRRLRPRLVDVPHTWRGVTIPPELARRIAQAGPVETGEVIEGVERDWSAVAEEVWTFRVVMTAPIACELAVTTWRGAGSCPVLWPSFMRVAGEVMGRGPVQIALPDIKTLNEMKRLILDNADMAITGLWQYDDDGVLNPDTVTIAPGTLIPRAMGSRGLEPLQSPARFDVAQMSIADLQRAVREALFWNDLGPLDQTPRSATEIMQRTADRAKRLTGPATNLLTEFLFPYVRRLAFIRRAQGAIQIGRIDGRETLIMPRGPLTSAQNEEAVLRFSRYMQLLQANHGPQAAGLMVDAEKASAWQAKKMGIDPSLIRTEVERRALAQSIAALAQQAAAAGMDPSALAGG